MQENKLIPEMTEERIIDDWKKGFTVEQISKTCVKSKKQRGIRITQLDAQKYVEPIIFKYQTNLLKA